MSRRKYLIFGISKGLGEAIAKYLPNSQNVVYGISRTMPNYLKEYANINWIKADLAEPITSTEIIKEKIKDETIDCLIYNAGIWEKEEFTNAYEFSKSSQSEIVNLININVLSCILAIQAVIENLKKIRNSKSNFDWFYLGT